MSSLFLLILPKFCSATSQITITLNRAYLIIYGWNYCTRKLRSAVCGIWIGYWWQLRYRGVFILHARILYDAHQSRFGLFFDPISAKSIAYPNEIRSFEKSEFGSFTLLHKISLIACCFDIRTLFNQYNCYESATTWYTDHQFWAQYSDIIDHLQEIPLMFCSYAVHSCGTWR